MPLWSLCKAWIGVVVARRDKGAQRGGPWRRHSILDQTVWGELEGRECLSTVDMILLCQCVASQGPRRVSGMQ